MDLVDVLAKAEWPPVEEDKSEQLTAILGDILAPLATISDPKDIPDLFEHVTIGFNSTMAAIETPEKPLLAVFICRKSLGPDISNLFTLPSATLGFKLVQLPPHKSLEIAKGVIGVRKSLANTQIETIVAKINNTTSNWAYQPAKLERRQKNPLRQ